MGKYPNLVLLFPALWMAAPVFSAKSVRHHQNKWNDTRSISNVLHIKAFIEYNRQGFSFVFYPADRHTVTRLSTLGGAILFVEQANAEECPFLNFNLNEPLPFGDHCLPISNGINEYHEEFSTY